jgi:hypothetical protein
LIIISSLAENASTGIIGVLCVLGICIWMLFRPHAPEPPRLLLVMLALVTFEQFANAYMDWASRFTPLKFDYFLYLVDKNLGVSAFSAARLLSEWQLPLLVIVYQSLIWVMLSWYWVILKSRDGRPSRLLIAYLINFVAGPGLYLLVPGRGPRHAFGAAFPMGSPDVSPVLVQLNGWPNAIPSLHVSTALLFLLFAGESRVRRGIAWAYLAGTVCATLAFEHYLIDLIVAVPFACFAALAAEGKFRKALGNFGLVLAWLLAIRFATPALVAYPIVLRTFAIATVAFAGFSMASRQLSRRGERLQPLSTVLPCTVAAGADLADAGDGRPL